MKMGRIPFGVDCIVVGTVLLSFLVILANSQHISELEKQDDEGSSKNDLAITYNQKVALDKFKQRMSPIVPNAYMREQIYLIRWLRATEFDLKNAEDLLAKNLKWRKENNIDNILEEDFSDLSEDQPGVYVDMVDKKGQPIISNTIWNFRNAWVTGKDRRILRYIVKVLEQASKIIRDEQQNGKNITRFDYLINMEPFNLIQHGCSRCMLSYFQILRNYEQYYPDMIDRLTIINAPPAIRTLFRPVAQSALTYNTIRSVNMKIFGMDKNEWKRYLLKFIDEEQLTEEFGGTRIRKN